MSLAVCGHVVLYTCEDALEDHPQYRQTPISTQRHAIRHQKAI